MLALLSARRPNDAEYQKAVRTLFSKDAGLAVHPGPAALLHGDGSVVVANAATSAVADALGLGAGRAMHPTLAGAIRSGEPSTVAITFEAKAGEELAGVTFEFTVLPVNAKETALVIGRDTALETAFRGAVTESRQRYKDLVDICGDFCWETNAAGQFTFVSPSGALGYPAEALVGHHPAEYADPRLADLGDSPFTAQEGVNVVDVWFRCADGKYACLETSSRPIVDSLGKQDGARGVCRDVTADRGRQQELDRIQMRDRLIAHIMRTIRDEIEPDKILEAAAQATAQAIGAQGCRIFREHADSSLVCAAEFGTTPPPDQVVAGALVRARDDGRPFAAEQQAQSLLCVATSYRHACNGAIVLWRDAEDQGWSTEDRTLTADVAVQLGVAIQQIRYQLELETLSRTDALTGLLNRRAFTAELEARLARTSRTTAGTLFYVDLDNFKPVNDILGHQKGDEALVAVAEMLVRKSRSGDLVARLGGDEFALWLDRTDEAAARQRATDLLDGAGCLEPFSGDPDRPLGISIGVAVLHPNAAEDIGGLTARADAAMYQVKKNGKDGFVIAPCRPNDDIEERRAANA